MVGDKVFKVVSDPVHGSIPLNDIECQVMQTQVFQRLRRIKQLGLANYVFPSADYSRLSHSLGVCHITGLIMDSLERAGVSDAKKNRQYYRLAALLHDVGHLPLSHCTEHAAIDYYSDRIAASKIRLATDSDDPTDAADKISAGVKHEYISEMLLVNDGELGSVLEAGGYDPKDVASIFLREATSAFPLSNLISSDLDADRFDYLLSQMVPDNKGNVCIGHKGMRAAEHFLLCRYFDYQQVVYHKAVVGLEQLAQQIIGYLLANNRLDFSRERVKSAITDNTVLELKRRLKYHLSGCFANIMLIAFQKSNNIAQYRSAVTCFWCLSGFWRYGRRSENRSLTSFSGSNFRTDQMSYLLSSFIFRSST